MEYLSSKSPTPFDLVHLESDLAATPTLQMSQVGDILCYRSGVHEFLLFIMEPLVPGRKFWMRLDRRPKRGAGSWWSSQRAAAYDTYCMNYDRAVLLADEQKHLDLIDGLTNLSDPRPPSMHDIMLLMKTIQGASNQWGLLRENCRWFCAVTLDSLQGEFGGVWLTSKLHRGVANFRGFRQEATKSVQGLYKPWFVNKPESNERTTQGILSGKLIYSILLQRLRRMLKILQQLRFLR
jgi:hypothetical protein